MCHVVQNFVQDRNSGGRVGLWEVKKDKNNMTPFLLLPQECSLRITRYSQMLLTHDIVHEKLCPCVHFCSLRHGTVSGVQHYVNMNYSPLWCRWSSSSRQSVNFKLKKKKRQPKQINTNHHPYFRHNQDMIGFCCRSNMNSRPQITVSHANVERFDYDLCGTCFLYPCATRQ